MYMCHVYDCVCIQVCMGMNTYDCGGQKSMSSDFPCFCHPLPYFLRQDLWQNMELVVVARLAASKSQGSFSLCFPSVQSHVCTVGCHTWHFTWMPGVWHKSLCSMTSTSQSHRPSPHSALFGRRSPVSGCTMIVSTLLCTSSCNACLLPTPLLDIVSPSLPTLAFTGEPCLTPLVFLMLTWHQNMYPLYVFICKRKYLLNTLTGYFFFSLSP